MDALECFYQDLFGYAHDANIGTYDVDMQATKEHIEKILERGYLEDCDIEYIRSLLSENENDTTYPELRDYLDNLCNPCL